MSEDHDQGDKPYEPTPKRLEEARRKGQVVRSADVTAAASQAGFLLVCLMFGSAFVLDLGTAMTRLLSDAFIGVSGVMGEALVPALRSAILDTVLMTAPFFAIPAIAALAAVAAQRAFTMTPENLVPKLSRISLIANAKHKFGPQGLFEFVKSLAKLTLYGGILTLFLWGRRDLVFLAVQSDPGPALVVLVDLVMQMLGLVLVVVIVVAAMDYIWQYQTHMQRNRMSLKELRDEIKESEGDPAIKQTRHARAQAIAMRQIAAEIEKATVVIVNPTHYAVALRWDKRPGAAPICVAKGVDETALRMRAIAQAAGVPIHADPPTARALYAIVETGQEIAVEHYQAVAVAIRFAEDMRKKARAWM